MRLIVTLYWCIEIGIQYRQLCTTGEGSAQRKADARPNTTLRLAYDVDPVSLDPHEQLSGSTLQLPHMVFDPLVRWTQDLQFEPRLAEF